MIKVKKLSFKNLQKLNVQQRLEAIKTPGIGQVLMSALTPTQIAELFPRYYLMREPDISGFLKALPTGTTAAKQAAFQEQLKSTASGDAAGKNMEEGGWKRKLQEGVTEQTATPLKPGEAPQPKLTPEQKTVIESLQKGENIPASDPKVKFITTMAPQELKDVGLEKFKGEGDKEFYKYVPPVVTDEEVKKKISEQSKSSNSFFDAIMRAEGTSKQANPYDTVLGYGKYGSPSKRPSEMTVGEWLSFQKSLAEKYAAATGKEPASAMGAFQIVGRTLRNHYAAAGLTLDDVMTPENQKKVAAHIYQTEGLGAWEGFKSHPKEREIAEKSAQQGLHKVLSDPIAQDYSKEQLDAEREKVIREINAKRMGTIAEKTQAAQPEPEVGEKRLSVTGRAAQVGVGDPRLEKVLSEASRYLPEGYRVELYSGFRPGDPRFHGKGIAADVRIINPEGKAISNYQDPKDFRIYETFAQHARKIQQDKYPELEGSFRWGGYFSGGKGKYGALDLMHFDLAGKMVGMAGGSWEGGLTSAQKSIWGGNVDSQGMGSVKDFKLPVKKNEERFAPASAESEKNLKEEFYRSERNPFGNVPAIEAAEREKQKTRIEESLKPSPDVPPGVERPAPKGQNVPGQPLPPPAPAPAPEPPKIVPQRYKFNEAAFEDAVRNKYGILAEMYDRAGLIKEFKKKLPKGVTYEKGVLTIEDPNSPAIKETIAGLENEFGKETVKSVITQIKEEKKKEEPKPEVKAEPRPETTQQQRIEKTLRPDPDIPPGVERPAPQGQIRPRELKMDTKNSGVSFNTEKVQEPAPASEPAPSPVSTNRSIRPVEQTAVHSNMEPPKTEPPKAEPPKTEPPKAEPPKTEPPKAEPPKTEPPKTEPPKAEPVKTNAKGGENETNTSQISAMPIGGLKDDNSLVVDANQKPLFTMNTDKESAVYNPTERKVDVIPKGGQVGKTPTMQSDVDSLLSNIINIKDDRQQPDRKDITRGSESHISDRDPDMIEQIMNMTKHIFLDPSAARAFSRARFHETGDATNDFHHSVGNSNMK